MNVPKLNQDLKILLALFSQDKVTWRTDAGDMFVILKELRLPENIRPAVTAIKIPIPANLYDPAGRDQFHYYQNVFVDPGLKVRYPNGSWGQIPRHHDAPLRSNNDDGWRFLCLYPKGQVNGRTNISYFVRLVQVWFKNCLELNPRGGWI